MNPDIVAAQQELSLIGPSLAAFCSIATAAEALDDDLAGLAVSVAERALRLGLTRADQLLGQIEAASKG